MLNEAGTHRVFANVFPFFSNRLLAPEKAIETPRLPFPLGSQFPAHRSLDSRRKRADRSVPNSWSREKMNVIGHYYRGKNVPIRSSDRRLEGRKSIIVSENGQTPSHAKRDEIDHLLIKT
jgi:hypothetical protein